MVVEVEEGGDDLGGLLDVGEEGALHLGGVAEEEVAGGGLLLEGGGVDANLLVAGQHGLPALLVLALILVVVLVGIEDLHVGVHGGSLKHGGHHEGLGRNEEWTKREKQSKGRKGKGESEIVHVRITGDQVTFL